jgi:autotransporter-associated beta strand protein
MKTLIMKTPIIPKTTLTLVTAALTLLVGAAVSRAAIVTLTSSDSSGTTSMNTAGKWSNAQAPSSANDYFTGPFFVRTPPNNAGITFAGHSLTLGDVSGNPGSGGQGAPYRSILYKGTGGDVITINNLTNLAGSVINNGGSGAVTAPTFTGNLWTIAGNCTVISDQGATIIGYPIVGSANLTNSGSAQSGVHPVTYTGNLSGFTGKLILAQVNGGMVVNLNSGSSNLGNPATATPDQITIANGCALADAVGLAFTNANGGFTLLGGNGSINAAATSLIGEPITDLTNGVASAASLTSGGAGTLILSNANNTYSGGTTISAGVLQLGVNNAIPGNTIAGDVTDNATLDLNTHNATINGLNGSGTVDTVAGGTPTLTIGANGDNGTFSGTIQNSSGTLSLAKVGAGTETLSSGYTYSGNTVVAGGTLSLTTSGSLPSTPGGLIVSNLANLTINASSGTALPANNVVLATNGTVNLALNPTAIGINASGNLTYQDNATNNFAFGTVTGNPTAPAINVAGGIFAPGSNVVINITATGLKIGTFTLIKYTTGTLASLANFQLSPPPGVAATLVNNTANHSIDVNITSIPNQLVWNGVNGTLWNLTTANWTNPIAGGITLFQQYTNGSVIAGDAVTFDDTLTNDFVNPQPTNVNLTARFFAFPVVVNSTLPYSIGGAGGIIGVTSLVKSNTGSLTLLTSNSFTGGVFINDSGTLIITNDSALGASSGGVTLNGSTLQINGSTTNNRAISMPTTSTIGVGAGATVGLGGTISGASTLNKSDLGTLILTARETFTGDLFLHAGTTIIDSGGSLTNTSYHDIGQNGTDAATLTLRGTGAFSTTSDFNAGDLDSSTGTLNVSNSATLTANAIYIGSANAGGSTASGIVNQAGGTITEVSTAVGKFAIGGRTSVSGVGVYNMSGGTLIANAGIRVGGTGIGTLNQTGGQINALQGINIARIAGSFGTNNLNGGTLSAFNVASSTGVNAVFNFNGGILQAAFNPPTPWMFGLSQANILAGGAIIDSSNFNVTITQGLLAGSVSGGLTKKGAGTLTLSGTNTFTGPITNNAGTLILNSPSTYAGAAVINAGTLQLTTASVIQGGTMISNNAVLTVNQVGNAIASLGNLTFNGASGVPGATLALAPTVANNPANALLNCGTLTLNGTNTISLPIENIGTIALVKYTGAIAGSGNCTNLALPQGATGYISNNAANSTLYAVITSTGPGIFWTGTNSVAGHTNLWDISTTVNWLLGATATTYHQVVVPGDAVTFNDSGSGTVLLSNNVGPTSITISNNTKAYTFSGSGGITGPTGLLKLGSATAVVNLTNSTYLGNTTISNGTLQLGSATAISSSANLVVGSGGTLELAGVSPTVGELTGSGIIDNASGINPTLTVGSSSGGAWNGTIQDHGAGGVSLHKVGSGTWFVGGTNYLNDGQPFFDQSQINAGTVVITNGGLLSVANLQLQIASGAGNAAAVVLAGGTLAVSNNVLSVGYSTNATGTLTVNSGTVLHAGTTAGAGFASLPNSIDVGALGATGTLIVNGGQVLNNLPLYLGDGSTSSGTLLLNGGLMQALVVEPNNAPATSTAYFNGGTLQAVTNTADFLQVSSMVMSNGLVLDDNGYSVSISSQPLQSGDAFNGGLIKKGSGAVYLDNGNSYTGTTLVTNGMLAGAGSISGPVVVAPTGNLGAGDAGGIGGLAIYNNLTLQGNATMRISKTGGSPSQDQVAVSGNISYGGLLTITNVTTDATLLTTSDTFQLFSVSGSVAGNFAGIAGSPGAGLAYQFNPASGVLSIITQTYANNPTNITATVSGNTLTLSWPADHTGWILQTQTNALNAGLSAAGGSWFDVPASSSSNTNVITINPLNPTVFYRLRHP